MYHALQFKEETGRKGSSVFVDTAAHKAPNGKVFWLIYCITATVFDAATMCNVDDIDDATYPAGAFVYGHFTSVKLVSGTVQAFKTDL